MESELSVSYRATIDEAVESGFRLAEITGEVQRLKWYGLAFSPAFFVLMFFVLRDTGTQYAVGGFLTVLWVVWFLLTYRRQVRRQIRGALKRAYGSDEPIHCEYRLTDKSIHHVQGRGQEFVFHWETVKSAERRDGALEMVMEPAAIIRIPLRVFTEEGMLERWMEHIRSRTAIKEI